MSESLRRGDDAPPSGTMPLGPGFTVDFGKPLAEIAASGVKAFQGRWDASGEGAVVMLGIPGRPPRHAALEALTNTEVPECMAPLRHGAFGLPGGEYAVVVSEPKGTPLLKRGARITPWSEDAVYQELVRPVARALSILQHRGVTHRGIRPDNIFLQKGAPSVTLGEAWIVPPAAFQPAWVEPLASAAADPDGRGDGTSSDDIFSLGATMLALLTGAEPTESDQRITRLRLERGSFAALASNARLSSRMTDLLRSMLSDEAIQRPNAEGLLQIAGGAAIRRVVMRPIRRAARPFETRGDAIWDARSLGHMLASDWAHGLRLMESAEIEMWVRRILSDTPMAARIESVRTERSKQSAGGADRLTDDVALMRTIGVLDPTAPIAWRGQRFLPGGLPGQAAAAYASGDERSSDFLAFLQAGGVAAWLAAINEIEGDKLSVERGNRELRTMANLGPPVGGIRRLAYQLNPLLGCRSPLLRKEVAHGIGPMLAALDRTAAANALPLPLVLDPNLIAFIAAAARGSLDAELRPNHALSQAAEAGRLLRLLAILQRESSVGPLPALAKALNEACQPLLRTYRSKARRVALAEELEKVAQGGMFDALLGRLENNAERQADQAGFAHAESQANVLRTRLRQIVEQQPARRRRALQLGADIASALGWLGVVASTLSMLSG